MPRIRTSHKSPLTAHAPLALHGLDNLDAVGSHSTGPEARGGVSGPLSNRYAHARARFEARMLAPTKYVKVRRDYLCLAVALWAFALAVLGYWIFA
jgi:hypothetical protein